MASLAETIKKVRGMQLPRLQTKLPTPTKGNVVSPNLPEPKITRELLRETIKGLPTATFKTFRPIVQPVIERRAFEPLRAILPKTEKEAAETLLIKVGDTFIDPIVFGTAIKGLGKAALTRLAKFTKELDIVKELTKGGITREVSETLATRISKVRTVKEVESVLKSVTGKAPTPKKPVPELEPLVAEARQYGVKIDLANIGKANNEIDAMMRFLNDKPQVALKRIGISQTSKTGAGGNADFIQRRLLEIKTEINKSIPPKPVSALEPLATEARKFKTADEFVEARQIAFRKGAPIRPLTIREKVIKKETMEKAKKIFDERVAKIKDSKEIIKRRRDFIRAVRDHFGLTELGGHWHAPYEDNVATVSGKLDARKATHAFDLGFINLDLIDE